MQNIAIAMAEDKYLLGMIAISVACASVLPQAEQTGDTINGRIGQQA